MSIKNQPQASLKQVFHPVLNAMTSVVSRVASGHACHAEVDHLESLLETLPLTSDEFGIACNRLSNARRFLQADERGAARWELAALANRLRTQANAAVVEPRRRIRS